MFLRHMADNPQVLVIIVPEINTCKSAYQVIGFTSKLDLEGSVMLLPNRALFITERPGSSRIALGHLLQSDLIKVFLQPFSPTEDPTLIILKSLSVTNRYDIDDKYQPNEQALNLRKNGHKLLPSEEGGSCEVDKKHSLDCLLLNPQVPPFFDNQILSNLSKTLPCSHLERGSYRSLQSFPLSLHSAGFASMGESWPAPGCSC